MTLFGKGCAPDPVHKRTQRSSRLLLAAPTQIVAEASLERFEEPILDQGGYPSCGGHGTSQGIYQALAMQASPPKLVSPNYIYKTPRVVMRTEALVAGNGLPLLSTIQGIIPSSIMTALQINGIIPMGPFTENRISDCGAGDIDTEENLSDLEEGATKLLTGEFRVDETANDFVDQVAASLAQGFGLGIGVFVDSTFENWGVGWMPGRAPVSSVNLADPKGGGHWLNLNAVKYDHNLGKYVFSGPNSWSENWGAPALVDNSGPNNVGGHFRVTEDWMRQAVSDCYVWKVSIL